MLQKCLTFPSHLVEKIITAVNTNIHLHVNGEGVEDDSKFRNTWMYTVFSITNARQFVKFKKWMTVWVFVQQWQSWESERKHFAQPRIYTYSAFLYPTAKSCLKIFASISTYCTPTYLYRVFREGWVKSRCHVGLWSPLRHCTLYYITKKTWLKTWLLLCWTVLFQSWDVLLSGKLHTLGYTGYKSHCFKFKKHAWRMFWFNNLCMVLCGAQWIRYKIHVRYMALLLIVCWH